MAHHRNVDPMELDPVRANICASIDALHRDFRRLSLLEISRRADGLRSLGRRHGFDAVCLVAGGLADAVARDGRAAMIPSYLQSLREAAHCDEMQPDASMIFLASVGVRLAG